MNIMKDNERRIANRVILKSTLINTLPKPILHELDILLCNSNLSIQHQSDLIKMFEDIISGDVTKTVN